MLKLIWRLLRFRLLKLLLGYKSVEAEAYGIPKEVVSKAFIKENLDTRNL